MHGSYSSASLPYTAAHLLVMCCFSLTLLHDMRQDVLPMRFGDSQPRVATMSRLRFSQSVDYMMDYASDEDDLKLPSIKGALRLEGTASLSPRSEAAVKKVKKAVGFANKGPVREPAKVLSSCLKITRTRSRDSCVSRE